MSLRVVARARSVRAILLALVGGTLGVAACGHGPATVAGSGGGAATSSSSSQASSGAAGSTSSASTSGASTASSSSSGAASSSASSASSSSSGAGAGGSSPDGGSPVGLSYLIGAKCGLTGTCPNAVESWLGRPVDVAGETINTNAWVNGTPYTQSTGPTPLMESSFPLLSIYGETNGMTDMAAAASGAYDTEYTKMAEALASWDNPLLSVRIGWEFNGNWYPWSNGVGTNATYANYVAAFKRVAAIVKKANPHVLIQWCVAWGAPATGTPTTQMAELMQYWPGTYDPATNPGGVDVISMDFYQADITQYSNGGKQSTWPMVQGNTFTTINLDWMVTFAQQQGIKVALSEYAAGAPASKGAGSGAGLDDGAWAADAIAWMNGLPPGLLLWANWSDDAPADDLETASANPKEQAAWIAAWRNTTFTGTWWPGPKPY